MSAWPEGQGRKAVPIGASFLSPAKKKPLMLVTEPLVNAEALKAMLDSHRLDGWKKLTSGATLGGPELVRVGDEVWLVATGADHVVQAGRIDLNAKAVEPSTWAALSDPVSYGATSCIRVSTDPGERTVACATLAKDGAIRTFSVRINTDGIEKTATASPPVGSGSAARPALGLNDWFDNQLVRQVTYGLEATKPIVWSGGAQLWLDGMNSKTARGWATYPIDKLASGVSCDVERCAYRRIDGAAETFRISTYFPDHDNWDTRATEEYYLTTPPLPNASEIPEVMTTSGVNNVAVTIVMADKGGTVWLSAGQADALGHSAFQPWVSIGGLNKTGSSPSCVNYATTHVCAIQAMDGSIYMRQVGNSGGL